MTSLSSLSAVKKAIKSNPKVVLEFYATWCGACDAMKPEYSKLNKKTPGVRFYKVDVDKATEATDEYDVNAMPTFIYFKNGKKVGTYVGDIDSLKKALK